MARLKIDYGIDLGTTNSAICRMEKGEPIVKKTDVLKDTMPSCVSVNKKGSIKVGDSAYNTMKSDKRRASKSWSANASNTYIEFKRTMATDTSYPCPNLGKNFTSEELSAEVLKTLKSFITDENISSAVITVPAKFTVNQKTATIEAGHMAGFKQVELLQEPLAAAWAYGLKADDKNGIWMVFDFGGGTFDAALLKSEDGIMQVVDTEGDNYLGGKNLDYAIVDAVIIPYLQKNYAIEDILADPQKKEVLRDTMKTYAEEVKNQLSFKTQEDILSNLGELGEDEDGEEIELDLTVTQTQAFDAMRPHFQKAVDICKDILQRNHLSGNQLTKLILVGGPTNCPLIRQMLREQITPNVDTSIDPMIAVAMGAALYASTIDATEEQGENVSSSDLVRLDVGYEATSVETTEWVSIKLDAQSPLAKVWVELIRSDKAWASGKIEIDKIGNVLEANLVEAKPNSFEIRTYDAQGNTLPCFPNEITIIQGTKVGAAPLPYNIGIDTYNGRKKRIVFKMAKGLEKNKPLPAIGKVENISTRRRIRPGVSEDGLSIAVYQVDDYTEAEGRSVSLYEYVSDVVISGDEVDTLVPAGTPLEVELKVDTSEQMQLVVKFLDLDLTIEKTLDTGKKHSINEAARLIEQYLREGKTHLQTLSEEGVSVQHLEMELNNIKEENTKNAEKKAVLQHLKEVLRKIEDLDENTEWERLETQLRDTFKRLEKAQRDLGNQETQSLVEQLRAQLDQVIRSQNVDQGHDILEEIEKLYFSLTLVYQCIGVIQHCDTHFGTIEWQNPSRARQLINQGLSEITDQPTAEKLQPIVVALIDLMPDDDIRDAGFSPQITQRK